MEKALRYELETQIPELAGNIYPMHAPKDSTKPYLVYARMNTEKGKNYDGYTKNEELTFMFSCMATKYDDMKNLTLKIENFLTSILQSYIGTEKIFIQDVTINNISEQWEIELGVNRGIIDFTIFI